MRPILRLLNRLLLNSLSKQFLILAVILIGVFGLTVLAVLGSLESIYRRMIYSSIDNIVRMKAVSVEKYFSDCYGNIDYLSGKLTFHDRHAKKFGTFSNYIVKALSEDIENYKLDWPSISEILVLDINGDIIIENKYKKTSGQNKRDRAWFVSVLGSVKKQYSTNFFKPNKDATFNYFIISSAVRNSRNEVAGVVAVVYNIKPLMTLVSTQILGHIKQEYIVNSQTGEIIVHEDRRKIGIQKIVNTDLHHYIQERRAETMVYTGFNGKRVIGGRYFIKDVNPKFSGWVYVAERNEKEAMTIMEIPQKTLGSVLLAAIIGLIFIIYIFSLITIQPIKKLNEAAKALAAGDLKKRIAVARTDEIGTLSNSFNHMAGELQILYKRLHHKIKLTKAELLEVDQELKKKQEQLIRSEKLAAMGKLTAGIAHEIRNPLQSIKLFVQSRQGRSNASAREKKDTQLIMKEIGRIEEHINRFVDFARPEKPTFKPGALWRVVDDTASLLKGKFSQKKINLNIRVPKNIPMVYMDEKKMSQVFMNLFLNAFDAMKSGGTITVQAAVKRTGARPEVQISVADSGAGIHKEDIPYIFDPFVTGKNNGTGLGLSIVYSIIELHKGTIDVQSEINSGTVFHITLPLETRKARQ